MLSMHRAAEIGRPSDSNDKTLTIMQDLSLNTGECALIWPRRGMHAPFRCSAQHFKTQTSLSQQKNTRLAETKRVFNSGIISLEGL